MFPSPKLQKRCEVGIAKLPKSLQHVAVCYAAGIADSLTQNDAKELLRQHLTQMLQLSQQVPEA